MTTESEIKDRQALAQILEAFPDKSIEEIERLIRSAFRSMYPKK